ncbi:MAG TPA: LysM domain-containing protein [Solirubrobacterales bacterium]|jgi:LysM repeat protein|nr:LysM domain-containing protein [Solirubrobacterales bacterium]
MEKRTSAFTRIFAAIALAGAVVLVIAVVSSSLGGSDSTTKSPKGSSHKAEKPKTTAATYVVKSGDTLVSIAHSTGVPVAHIKALNPEVDPQILIAGQTLKLR